MFVFISEGWFGNEMYQVFRFAMRHIATYQCLQWNVKLKAKYRHWHWQRRYFQERPLKVWSHEQHASPGPKLLHPGERTAIIFLTRTFKKCCLIYFQAMDHLAEQLHHPLFVIVTDDPIWAKGKIPPGFRPVFTGENFSDSFEFLPTNHNYLGFYNESAQDSAGLDLAVLATCNYTILSRFAFKCVCKHVYVGSDHCHFNPGRFHSIMESFSGELLACGETSSRELRDFCQNIFCPLLLSTDLWIWDTRRESWPRW